MTQEEVKNLCVQIEKEITKFVSNQVEVKLSQENDRVIDEVVATVAALFSARSVAMIHIWSGEPVKAVRDRVYACTDENIVQALKSYAGVKQLFKPQKPS